MSQIKIANARLSFPSLFQHETFGGESTSKYAATLILSKTDHADAIKQIQAAIKAHVKNDLKGAKLAEDKVCLKDGDAQNRPEYEGCYTIKASTKKRPVVIDKDKSPLTEEDDDKIYAGVRVNAIIHTWSQNNSYGKRVNCGLDGIQFCQHDEPFTAGGVDVDEFADFDDGMDFDDDDDEF